MILLAAFWVVAVMASLFLLLALWVTWWLHEARRQLALSDRTIEAQDEMIRTVDEENYYLETRCVHLEHRLGITEWDTPPPT